MIQDLEILRRITDRALVHMTAMIYRANHRNDALPGDPKVGGHPAACTSCLEILAALHLVVREPEDHVCCKPHASPTDHALHHLLALFRDAQDHWLDAEPSKAAMDRLRAFSKKGEPVFQSYHASSDPDSFHFLPSGSVGIPPVASVYLALAYQYARHHGFDVEQPHFWCLIGDSEFREGSLMEVLPDAAERELGNVTWIIDYNRQNLDGTRIPNRRALQGTDAVRIQKTCEANGWQVIQVRHGPKRRALFHQPGGAALRTVLEDGFTDYHIQSLFWKKDGGHAREAILEIDPSCDALLAPLGDEEVYELLTDLGGHDLEAMVAALHKSKEDPRVPCVIVAHTIKGRGLACAAAAGNHSALPTEAEMRSLLAAEGLTLEQPFEIFADGSAEATFLAARSKLMREGIEKLERTKQRNLTRVAKAIDQAGGLPESLEINTKLVPRAPTQWMWGQLAAKLVRIGVFDELRSAGRKAGKDLTSNEQRFNTIADLLLTMAPDVGTSTNINPAMDEKVFGPDTEQNWEKSLELSERLRPELAPTDEAWTRHIRFEIAEANCMSAAGSFGKMGDLIGIPFLPMMTVYDFFIKRALDQLYYNLYWGAGFVLVGTPSGVTLSAEGAQHSWKSDIQIPNLITWEPAFAIEMDWILCDALQRHFAGDDAGRKGVLLRAVTRGIEQKLLLKNLRRQARCKEGLPQGALLGVTPADGGLSEAEVPARPEAEILEELHQDVLRGGYRLAYYRGYQGYEPGENVVHLFVMGALVPEALAASEALLQRGIFADVIVATCPDLLCGTLGAEDDHSHLREGLGVDGHLHLGSLHDAGRPLDELAAIDLAGRRIPIVSVHDGEPGLLNDLGSVIGVKQIALAVRRFSKSGTPAEVYRFHGLDEDAIVTACGRALAETALEQVRLSPGAFAHLQARDGEPAAKWRELWPDPLPGSVE